MPNLVPKVTIVAGLVLAVGLIAPRVVHRPATTSSTAATPRPLLVARGVDSRSQPAPAASPGAARRHRHGASAVAASDATTGAWITLGSYVATPGQADIAVTGGGFAPGEWVDVRIDGAGAHRTTVLKANDAGAVAGTVSVQLASDSGPVHVQATGRRSGAGATAILQVASSTSVMTLTPYAARPGESVDVQGRGFAAGEPVRLIVGSAPVAHAHAGPDGALQWRTAYTVPFAAQPGFLSMALVGEQSHQVAWQRLYVVPLRPWATASSYVVHAGDRVLFEVNGFAAGEAVGVYQGQRYLGRSSGLTDTSGHLAIIGPFTVPRGTSSPTYTFVGTRSGARLRVTLTVPQA